MRAWTGVGFPLAVLIALSALTLWLKHAAELPDEKPVDKRRHDPDTIIENFTAATLDPNGKPLHLLSAERLVHFADDNSSDLTQPRLRYTPAGQPVITLKANRGRALAGTDQVTLLDDVRIEQLTTPTTPGWIATMPDITALPPLGTASTDSPVVLTQGLGTLRGTGFSLDQKARTTSLNAAVRGNFPPRTSPTQ